MSALVCSLIFAVVTAAEMHTSIAQARSAQEQAVQVNYSISLCCLACS